MFVKTTLILLLFTIPLGAQISRNDSRISDAITDLTNRMIHRNSTEGTTLLNSSPYFEPQFKEAKVIYFGEALPEKVYLRYNAFSDEMEMSMNPTAKETDQALIKNSKVSCIIEGTVYRYLPLANGNLSLSKTGYVREIYQGQHYNLYLRERKIYREAIKARTSLERSFPARFVDESEWYIQTKEGGLRFIKPTKKYLKYYFKSNSEHLETFLKTKRGDLKEVDYLRRLVQFMDEINQESE